MRSIWPSQHHRRSLIFSRILVDGVRALSKIITFLSIRRPKLPHQRSWVVIFGTVNKQVSTFCLVSVRCLLYVLRPGNLQSKTIYRSLMGLSEKLSTVRYSIPPLIEYPPYWIFQLIEYRSRPRTWSLPKIIKFKGCIQFDYWIPKSVDLFSNHASNGFLFE